MKILVLYYSKGGNTRRLAEAIAEGVARVEGATPILKKTDEVAKEDFVEAAGIIAGSPVYFGTMAAQLKCVFDDFVGIRKKKKWKTRWEPPLRRQGMPPGGRKPRYSPSFRPC